MLLEEIKKECKVVINEEHQGEELYFDEKPTHEVITILKENCYRWHRTKHCWYRKLNYTGKRQINQEQKNYLGVKVGDIFHYSWGYEQTNANYFQVVALKGTKQVIIREIAYKTTETTGLDSYRVAPCKDRFLQHSQFIKNNDIGAVKQVKGLQNGTIYISIESFGFCSLWDGKDDLMTCYY